MSGLVQFFLPEDDDGARQAAERQFDALTDEERAEFEAWLDLQREARVAALLALPPIHGDAAPF